MSQIFIRTEKIDVNFHTREHVVPMIAVSTAARLSFLRSVYAKRLAKINVHTLPIIGVIDKREFFASFIT